MTKKNVVSKKSIAAILALICAVTNYPSIQVDASVRNHKTDAKVAVSKEEWKNAENSEYPVNTNSDEWASLSLEEAQKVCDMPSDMLSECSTKELAEYVLNYPLLIDMLAFDRTSDGIEHLKETSNVMEEYFSREDAVEVLLDAYNNLSVEYDSLTDTSKKNPLKESNYEKELFLQGYFATEYNELDRNQVDDLVDILGEKYDQKVEEDAVDDCVNPFLFYETLQEENGSVPEQVIPENIYEAITADNIENGGNLAGYTPGDYECSTDMSTYNVGKYKKYGKKVGCLKWKSGDYSRAQKDILKAAVLNDHPNWDFISHATAQYNCHSYAWISRNLNKYWLNNPDVFASSDNFKKIAKGKEKKKGDIVILDASSSSYDIISGKYTKALHSVVMTSELYCKSKLGSLGVFKTSLSDMQNYYGASSVRTYRKK